MERYGDCTPEEIEQGLNDMAKEVLGGSKDVLFFGDRIGGICWKPQGHWTAYLATPTGDVVIGQYPTEAAAVAAVEEADTVATVDWICGEFAD